MLLKVKRFGWWIVGIVAGTVISLYVIEYWNYLTTMTEPITLDFNDTDRCTQGKLADIVSRQMTNVSLDNGADALIICDGQPLTAMPSELPRSLANKIPGCLKWSSGSRDLVLVRKSDAVCSLPGERTYVCDGASARVSLGENAVGNSDDEIASCSDKVLAKFGFQ